MADQYYEQLWDEAMIDLERTKPFEKVIARTKVYPDRNKGFINFGKNYIKYCVVVTKLGRCYDQLVNPQERAPIKTVLELCIARLLELKHTLVALEDSDFNYFDRMLVARKMTPFDLAIQVPPFYRIDRREFISNIERLIDDGIREYQEKLAQEEAQREAEEAAALLEEMEEDEEFGDLPAPVDPFAKMLETPIIEDTVQSDTELEYDPRNPMKKRRGPKLTPEQQVELDAIVMIQRHERTRIARLKAQVLREAIRLKEDIAWLRHQPIPEDVQIDVQDRISYFWFRYRERRRASFICLQRNLVLGLLVPSYIEKSNREERDKWEDRRRVEGVEAQKALEDAAVTAKIRIQRNRAQFTDDIADELRYWIKHWYDYTKSQKMPMLPTYPDSIPVIPGPGVLGGDPGWKPKAVANLVHLAPEIKGLKPRPLIGSELIVAGHWIPVEPFCILTEMMAVKKKPGLNKPPAPKRPMSKKELAKLAKEAKEEAEKALENLKRKGFVPDKSKTLPNIVVEQSNYSAYWSNRYPTRDFDITPVENEELLGVQREVRMIVDDVMREELVILQLAMEEDKKREEKKKRKKKTGAEEIPPDKVRKPPPPPKPMDAPRRRKKIVDDNKKDGIVKEMAAKGLVVKYEKEYIDDIMGDVSVSAGIARRELEDPPPRWGDFRQVVKEYCVLPLGSKVVHKIAPKVKSVLMCGPELITDRYVNAICTEAGAVLVHLDPLTAKGLYKRKRKLQDHLTKSVKLFEPTVIHVKDAEKMFHKKLPSEEKDFKPGDLAKILKKAMRAIRADSLVLILGTTTDPTVTKWAKMKKLFKKVLVFPSMDQSDLNQWWIKKLSPYHGVDRYYNTVATARVTIGISLEALERSLNNIMTAERIIQLKYKPLDPMEIYFSPEVCEVEEDKDRLKKEMWPWCVKSVACYKKRKATLAVLIEKRDKERAADEPQKKPGEKKKPKKKFKEAPQVMNWHAVSHRHVVVPKRCDDTVPVSQKYTKVKPDLHRQQPSLEKYPIKETTP